MSLSLALSNALSGLNVNTRQAELTSNNVANALTEGYARRDLEVTSAAIGGVGSGARVVGVTRAASASLTEARRLGEADSDREATLTAAKTALATALGEPGGSFSLSGTADTLDAALSEAADTPESLALLDAAVRAAVDYANKVNSVADKANSIRSDADASIANQVSVLNRGLGEIESLNQQIKAHSISGTDTSALEDQRQRLIDDISGIVPVSVVRRENNEVALFTTQGAQLLDGSAFEIGFAASPIVTPEQSILNGALSGITIAGNPIEIGTGSNKGFLDGGSLSAAFEVRDNLVPDFIAQLDAVGVDLISRVEGLAEDATLTAGDPGLFTDNGSALDLSNTVGLASRLSVNSAVDPLQGGEPTRLRDGLNATQTGEAGESALLRGLQDALLAFEIPPSETGVSTAQGAAGLVTSVSNQMLTQAAYAEELAALKQGRLDTLRDSELAQTAVSSDQELAYLLVVEQNYAANARVIEVIDELLTRLLQI